MVQDFALCESPDRPAISMSKLVEACILLFSTGLDSMPIIAVRLHDQPHALKDEIGLEPPEHSLVHNETKASLFEFIVQVLFQRGHAAWKCLRQSMLAMPFTIFHRFPDWLHRGYKLLALLRSPFVASARAALIRPSSWFRNWGVLTSRDSHFAQFLFSRLRVVKAWFTSHHKPIVAHLATNLFI